MAGISSKGLSVTIAVIDGNAKLARRICGRAVAELLHCAALGKYTAVQCADKPCFKKARCQKHAARVAGDAAGPPQTEVIVGHRRRRILHSAPTAEPYDVCFAIPEEPQLGTRWGAAGTATPGQLQEYWDKQESRAFMPSKSSQEDVQASKCKTHKEEQGTGARLRRRFLRAGWLYACTPDGYVLHLKEYTGAESLSQRYFFLAELVKKYGEVKVVIHDDACHLRKYTTARAADGDMATRLAFPQIQYITDRLHAKGHVDPWCLANCAPTAECNRSVMENVNSQICEQCFSRLGRHKYVVRAMGPLTSAFFLNEMAEVQNQTWLTEH